MKYRLTVTARIERTGAGDPDPADYLWRNIGEARRVIDVEDHVNGFSRAIGLATLVAHDAVRMTGLAFEAPDPAEVAPPTMEALAQSFGIGYGPRASSAEEVRGYVEGGVLPGGEPDIVADPGSEPALSPEEARDVEGDPVAAAQVEREERDREALTDLPY